MALPASHLSLLPLCALLSLAVAQTPSAPSPSASGADVSCPEAASGALFTITFLGKPSSYSSCLRLPPSGLLLWNLTGINSTHASVNTLFQNSPQNPYGWVAYGPSPNARMVNSTVAVVYGDAQNPNKAPGKGFYLLGNKTGPGIALLDPPPLGATWTAVEIRTGGALMLMQNTWVVTAAAAASNSSFVYGQGPGFNFQANRPKPHAVPPLNNSVMWLNFSSVPYLSSAAPVNGSFPPFDDPFPSWSGSMLSPSRALPSLRALPFPISFAVACASLGLIWNYLQP